MTKVITKTDWLAALKKSPAKKRKKGKKEENDQTAFAAFVRLMYPHVEFTSDICGMYLTIGQRVRVNSQRSKGKKPDMTFYEPMGPYHGLVLELKSEEDSPFSKKDGKILMNKHVVEQAAMLQRFRNKGYKAEFAVGYEGAKRIFVEYMSLK